MDQQYLFQDFRKKRTKFVKRINFVSLCSYTPKYRSRWDALSCFTRFNYHFVRCWNCEINQCFPFMSLWVMKDSYILIIYSFAYWKYTCVSFKILVFLWEIWTRRDKVDCGDPKGNILYRVKGRFYWGYSDISIISSM